MRELQTTKELYNDTGIVDLGVDGVNWVYMYIIVHRSDKSISATNS